MFKTRFISMLVLLAAVVTGAVAQNYKVSVKEGTEDATSWTIAPAEATTTGVAAGTTVTATYSGTKKVKSVKAKKKAAPAGNPLPTTSSISGYMGGAFAWDGNGSPTSDFSMNLFNAGDKISLLSENNANVQLTTSEGGAEATFSGTAVDGEPTYYAVYPYTDGLALSGTTITGIVIPSIQWNIKWYEGINSSAWDPNAPVAYATTTGSSLQFRNLCAILKIKVVGSSDHSDAGKITISADQALAGTFSLDTSTGTLTATEGSTTVDTGDTWDAGHWVYFENNYCYFAIAPGTYSNFKVRTDIWGELKEEKTKASVTFEKGKIYDLGEFSCN